MPLAIELPDGSLIADGDWNRMDDVMRASHGHGVNVMPGRLIQVDENLQRYERCDYSWLYENECAHCQGHVADWEITPKVVAYD